MVNNNLLTAKYVVLYIHPWIQCSIGQTYQECLGKKITVFGKSLEYFYSDGYQLNEELCIFTHLHFIDYATSDIHQHTLTVS